MTMYQLQSSPTPQHHTELGLLSAFASVIRKALGRLYRGGVKGEMRGVYGRICIRNGAGPGYPHPSLQPLLFLFLCVTCSKHSGRDRSEPYGGQIAQPLHRIYISLTPLFWLSSIGIYIIHIPFALFSERISLLGLTHFFPLLFFLLLGIHTMPTPLFNFVLVDIH